MNGVHIQQRTRDFKNGGMTPCHHTCDRWPNFMPLYGQQTKRLRGICLVTGRWCHCTNRQTSNVLYEGQVNHTMFRQEDIFACYHIEDWQIYATVHGTSSINIVFRELCQPIIPKIGRSIPCHYWQMGQQHGIMLTSGSTQGYGTEEWPTPHCWTKIKEAKGRSSN